ncbi:hypothetical protein AAMO2058_000967800, partial [Amorphochlora amoebiformis]
MQRIYLPNPLAGMNVSAVSYGDGTLLMGPRGVPPKPRPVALLRQFGPMAQPLYVLPLMDLEAIRIPDTCHIRGADDMTTQDIRGYFAAVTGIRRVEWVNPSSCNVRFRSRQECRRALSKLSSPIPSEVKRVRTAILTLHRSHTSSNQRASRDESDAGLIAWRRGRPNVKGQELLLRLACTTDTPNPSRPITPPEIPENPGKISPNLSKRKLKKRSRSRSLSRSPPRRRPRHSREPRSRDSRRETLKSSTRDRVEIRRGKDSRDPRESRESRESRVPLESQDVGCEIEDGEVVGAEEGEILEQGEENEDGEIAPSSPPAQQYPAPAPTVAPIKQRFSQLLQAHVRRRGEDGTGGKNGRGEGKGGGERKRGWERATRQLWRWHRRQLLSIQSLEARRRERFQCIEKIILSVWRGAQVHVVGSSAFGLAGPHSDVDMEICLPSCTCRDPARPSTSRNPDTCPRKSDTCLQKPDTYLPNPDRCHRKPETPETCPPKEDTCRGNPRKKGNTPANGACPKWEKPRSALGRLLPLLRRPPLKTHLKIRPILNSKVPLLRIIDRSSKQTFDVSCCRGGREGGRLASEALRGIVQGMCPCAVVCALAILEWGRRRFLRGPGSMGSYPLTLLVLSHFQAQTPPLAPPPPQPPAPVQPPTRNTINPWSFEDSTTEIPSGVPSIVKGRGGFWGPAEASGDRYGCSKGWCKRARATQGEILKGFFEAFKEGGPFKPSKIAIIPASGLRLERQAGRGGVGRPSEALVIEDPVRRGVNIARRVNASVVYQINE